MYYNEDGNLLSLSYSTWLRECVKDRNAFIIRPKEEITDEEESFDLLGYLGCHIDAIYPERLYVKYFPVVKNLGHHLFSNDVALAFRDVDDEHPLTRSELQGILDSLKQGDRFEILDAQELDGNSMLCLLSLPLGFAWDLESYF